MVYDLTGIRKFTDYSGVSVYLRSSVARAIMDAENNWFVPIDIRIFHLNLIGGRCQTNERKESDFPQTDLSWKSPPMEPGSTWEDVGVLAGGANLTFNWDEFYLDAGNMKGLCDKAINPDCGSCSVLLCGTGTLMLSRLVPGFFYLYFLLCQPSCFSITATALPTLFAKSTLMFAKVSKSICSFTTALEIANILGFKIGVLFYLLSLYFQ